MRKFFYLLTLVCTLSAFCACSSDDDDDVKTTGKSAIYGTWNVKPTVLTSDGVSGGSVKINWTGDENATITVKDSTILLKNAFPAAEYYANAFITRLLKSITFNEDGSQTTVKRAKASDPWSEVTGYVTFEMKSENEMLLKLTDKARQNASADLQFLMSQSEFAELKGQGLPLHLRWSTDKKSVYIYLDQAYMEKILTGLVVIANRYSGDDLTEDQLATLKTMKNLVRKIPAVIEATNTCEIGIELAKQ